MTYYAVLLVAIRTLGRVILSVVKNCFVKFS
nr:MAG TPA: hypothetical protein [Caudoviricetes sp.]